MSLVYCFDCLERIDNCECGNPSDRTVHGELRIAYIQGYRDCENNKEMDI